MRELKQDWRDIFLAFRIARDPRKVLLGAIGVVLSMILLWVLAWGFYEVLNVISGPASKGLRNDAFRFIAHPAGTAVQNIGNLLNIVSPGMAGLGVSLGLWGNPVTIVEPRAAVHIFFITLAVGLLLIWSYFGGVISRIAAVELAKDERIELREARRFACRKYWAYLWAPLVPAVGVLIFGLLNFMGGLFGRIPFVGDLALGVFFWAALIAGFLIALIMIGGAAGYGLMVPAISAEGTDAFDGISRAYSYVYSRPWRFILYVLLGLGYFLLCAGFMYLFTSLTIKGALGTVMIGLKQFHGGPRCDAIQDLYAQWHFAKGVSWYTHVGAFLVGIWLNLVWVIFLGFVVSLKITCCTIVYFLMRKSVDGTEMTEVYTEEEEMEEETPAPGEKEVGEEAAEEEKKEGEEAAEDKAKKRTPRKKKEAGAEE